MSLFYLCRSNIKDKVPTALSQRKETKIRKIQLQVEAGKKVKVSLTPECLAAGGGREYPNGRCGVMTGTQSTHEKLAEVNFGSDIEVPHSEPGKKGVAYIPLWLLVSEEA